MNNDLKTEASWNDEGFFIKLIEEQAPDTIHWIWNNKKNEFEETYPNCDIALEKIDEKRYAISVRILNISMTDLINMSRIKNLNIETMSWVMSMNFKK